MPDAAGVPSEIMHQAPEETLPFAPPGAPPDTQRPMSPVPTEDDLELPPGDAQSSMPVGDEQSDTIVTADYEQSVAVPTISFSPATTPASR
jgi:hypothetical protein